MGDAGDGGHEPIAGAANGGNDLRQLLRRPRVLVQQDDALLELLPDRLLDVVVPRGPVHAVHVPVEGEELVGLEVASCGVAELAVRRPEEPRALPRDVAKDLRGFVDLALHLVVCHLRQMCVRQRVDADELVVRLEHVQEPWVVQNVDADVEEDRLNVFLLQRFEEERTGGTVRPVVERQDDLVVVEERPSQLQAGQRKRRHEQYGHRSFTNLAS